MQAAAAVRGCLLECLILAEELRNPYGYAVRADCRARFDKFRCEMKNSVNPKRVGSAGDSDVHVEDVLSASCGEACCMAGRTVTWGGEEFPSIFRAILS